MTKSCLSAVVLACAIPQLCAAAAALVGDRSVHAEAGPAQQEASSLSIVRPMPVTEIDALIRKEVLNDLARSTTAAMAAEIQTRWLSTSVT